MLCSILPTGGICLHSGDILNILFHGRREASWRAYLPIFIVLSSFATIGILNRGVFKELYLIVLLAISIAQIRYRTLVGWIVLLVCSLAYTGVAVYQVLVVFLNSATGINVRAYSVLFLVCGLASALALLAYRPWRAAETKLS